MKVTLIWWEIIQKHPFGWPEMLIYELILGTIIASELSPPLKHKNKLKLKWSQVSQTKEVQKIIKRHLLYSSLLSSFEQTTITSIL